MWPVGAVSKTMREKCAYSGLFTNCTTCMPTPDVVLSGPHIIYCLSHNTHHAMCPQLHACAAMLPCMCWTGAVNQFGLTLLMATASSTPGGSVSSSSLSLKSFS